MDRVVIRSTGFGRCDWQVTKLGLGTVELGMDYGVGNQHAGGKPSRQQAMDVLELAQNSGVQLLDTAPGYGDSETIVGHYFERRDTPFRIATKVELDGASAMEQSLIRSLERLHCPAIDLMQIHNATVASLEQPDVIKKLHAWKEDGRVRCLGASVYDVETVELMIDMGGWDAVQLPYNLLDRRMETAAKRASDNGIAVMIRSAYLKGALTSRAQYLPDGPLQQYVEQAQRWAEQEGMSLEEAALRFCLSQPWAAVTLVGISHVHELQRALEIAEQGVLTTSQCATAEALGCQDSRIVDPRYWEFA